MDAEIVSNLAQASIDAKKATAFAYETLDTAAILNSESENDPHTVLILTLVVDHLNECIRNEARALSTFTASEARLRAIDEYKGIDND